MVPEEGYGAEGVVAVSSWRNSDEFKPVWTYGLNIVFRKLATYGCGWRSVECGEIKSWIGGMGQQVSIQVAYDRPKVKYSIWGMQI